MKRTLIRLLIISCLLVEGGLNSVAQEKKPIRVGAEVPADGDSAQEKKLIRDGAEDPADGAFKVLGPKFAFSKVVKGAPYSATAITEHIQTLSDGNQIIRKNESKLYRDSEGRTRIEQTLETIGKWTAGGEAHRHIFINDPVAGVSYSVNPRTRVADKNIIVIKRPSAEAQGKTLRTNGQTITPAEVEVIVEKRRRAQGEPLKKPRKEVPNDPELEKQIEMFQQGIPRIEPGQGQKKSESLGTQTIEGVTAEGTRLTLTIPAGEIGNTLPIELVKETWYSPELQLVVMSKYRDPRSGETTYRLTNIDRSDPDHTLFEIPADHSVVEEKIHIKPPIKKRLPKEEQ